jgi:hypothetical protein
VVRIVEAHHEINKCTLATTRLAYQGNRLIWIDSQRKASQYKLVLSGRVPEPNILELNFSLNIILVECLGTLVLFQGIDLGWVLNNFEDFCGS